MIKDFIRQIKDIVKFWKISEKEKNIIFFSEGQNYFNVFKNYIEIIKKDKKIIFITSDKDDPIYKNKNKNLEIIYCKNIFLLIILINNISCRNLIMTMPDLNNYQLKKSKKVKNYIYIFHSLVSTHMIYRYKAFNHYDKILCITQNQFEELKKNKKKNNLKYELYKSNYPKLGVLKLENKVKLIENLITIAPSWGRNNIFENTGFESFLTNLTNKGFKIILRPHSQIKEKIKKKIFSIAKKYSDDQVIIEKDNLNFKNTFASKFLITDWSGIALEYYLITRRAVIFINTEKKINNKFFNEIKDPEPLEVNIRNKIGSIFDINENSKIIKFMKNYHSNNIKIKLKDIEKKILFQNKINEKNFSQLLV